MGLGNGATNCKTLTMWPFPGLEMPSMWQKLDQTDFASLRLLLQPQKCSEPLQRSRTCDKTYNRIKELANKYSEYLKKKKKKKNVKKKTKEFKKKKKKKKKK